jgi:hypothetical protein
VEPELDPRFIVGVSYGAIVVIILAFVLNRARKARTEAGLQYRPMSDIPASRQAVLTSAGVVGTSQSAGCREAALIILFIVAFLLSLVGCFYIASLFS